MIRFYIALIFLINNCIWSNVKIIDDHSKDSTKCNNKKHYYFTTASLIASSIGGIILGNKLGLNAKRQVEKNNPDNAILGDAAYGTVGLMTTIGLAGTGFIVGMILDKQFYEKEIVYNLAVGLNSNITWGPSVSFTSNYISLQGNYGFSKNKNRNGIVYAIKNSCDANIVFNLINEKYRKNFRPFFGIGFSYVKEKDNVEGINGDGYITGIHPFLGNKFILPPKYGNFGVSIKLGYSFWNYNNSILSKNKAELKYNYPKFYTDFTIFYFFDL